MLGLSFRVLSSSFSVYYMFRRSIRQSPIVADVPCWLRLAVAKVHSNVIQNAIALSYIDSTQTFQPKGP